MLEKWFKRATVRAVKTAAQSFLAVAGTTSVMSTAEWKIAIISAGTAAVLSYITSLAGLPEVNEDGLQNEV